MKRKIAIYARVSTDHEDQISALANQIQYYDEILEKNIDWELYDRYIDEGITGTSVNKRKNFLRMMQDAEDRKFDLILTREVSRFARNTVDTLQQTRILKSYGVEVWFIEDNIWTMNDEDGELRLSIMATLAQNESKKISSRVKAGQRVSFLNGIPYGNGNILGYDRVGRDYVINKEQAMVVRKIFDMYLAGYGARAIHYMLEQDNAKTACGKTNWHDSVIMKTLKNPFYCGIIEYRKEYTVDYLTQKKVRNNGEVEKIRVEGTHEPIVTKEEFEKVQQILATRLAEQTDGKIIGRPNAHNIWVKKARCKCGHTFNRRPNYTSKTTGRKTYTFQCYNQMRTGSIGTRLKKGLSIDGICDNNSFPQWKLEVQADFIFRKLLSNKQEVYDRAIEMLNSSISIDIHQGELKEKISNNDKEIKKSFARMDVLLDMCTDGDISRETYRKKTDILNDKIIALKKENESLEKQIESNHQQEAINQKMQTISNFLKMEIFSEKAAVPDTIIDKYVEKIIVNKNVFSWYLNPNFYDGEPLKIDTNKYNAKNNFSEKTMCDVNSSTGSYKQSTQIENAVFMGSYNIPRDYMKTALEYYYSEQNFNLPNSMKIKLYLV